MSIIPLFRKSKVPFRRRRRQGYLLSWLLVFSIILLGSSAYQVQSAFLSRQFPFEEFTYQGPYIDELTFSVYRDAETQWQALTDHQIDVGNLPITPQERADIQSNQWEVNAFWGLACSTHDDPYHVSEPFGPPEITGFPLNYVELRRAIAMAIDKYELAALSFGDDGVALDHVVPSSILAWHEPELPVDYRGSDLQGAMALLDAAGFLDVNGDGFREAPDSSEVSIRLYYPAVEEALIRFRKSTIPHVLATNVSQIAEYVGNTLANLDFRYDLNNVTEEYLWGVTHLGSRSYNLALLPFTPTLQSPFYLTDLFYSMSIPTTNIMNFANDTVDNLLEALNSTLEYDAFRDTVSSLQVAIAQNQPLIPLVTRYQYTAHRVDRFMHWVNVPVLGTPNSWSLRRVRLNADQVDRNPITGVGGTLEFGLGSTPFSLNPIITLRGVTTFNFPNIFSPNSDWLVLNNIYSYLVSLNPFTGESIPGLAKRWTFEAVGDELRITFNLVNNATWHDGAQFTAADVNFTYHYLNNLPGPWIFQWSKPHIEFSSIEVINNVTIAIQTPLNGYYALFHIASVPILPQHIWEGIVYPARFDNALPIGTGPFRFLSRPEPNLIKLGYHPDFHYGIEGARELPATVDVHLVGWAAGGLFVIVLTAVGAFWYLRRRPHGLSD